jgi:hypothetical protein
LWRGVYGSGRTWYFLYQLTAKADTLGTDTQASANTAPVASYGSVFILRVRHLKEENIQTHSLHP